MESMLSTGASRLLPPKNAAQVLAYSVLALPAGAVGLAVLIAGWATTLSLAVTPAGVGVLIGYAALLRAIAGVESALAWSLLGVPRRRAVAPYARGYWRNAPAILGDPTFWKQQLYMLLRVMPGWPIGIVLVAL